MSSQNYKPIIGLEVHIELKTKSKMFCSCSADYFGHKPNTHVCPVCLALPGALPVPNKKAIEWCIKIGLALNCKVELFSKFDRKNYFYPDLPKGYQISQYDEPFAVNGSLKIRTQRSNIKTEGEEKMVRIRRVHMEEDTGKLVHAFVNDKKISLIDFNRSGVPLVEIVTEPDFESGEEVKLYLQKLQQIVRYLNVSNADMEKGDMRLEPNISLLSNNTNTINNPKSNNTALPAGRQLPDYKVEVKNINSFKFVDKAINFEIKRQIEILEDGKIPKQETRGWDEKKQITVSQRTKEEAHDYRYFPDPDIPPFRFDENQISNIKNQIPELADEKIKRLMEGYSLSEYDAEILTRDKKTADYFEEAVKANNELRIINHESTEPKTIANWIVNKKVDTEKNLPAELIETIIKSRQKVTIDEEELEKVLMQVLTENSKAVKDFKEGKKEALMFLLGKTLRKFGKKVDIAIVKAKIEALIEKI